MKITVIMLKEAVKKMVVIKICVICSAQTIEYFVLLNTAQQSRGTVGRDIVLHLKEAVPLFEK